MQPRVVFPCRCELGEGPLWNPDDRRLYWTDIPRHRLYRGDPATGSHEAFNICGPVGGFTFQADGALLLFMADGAVRAWRDGRLTTVVDEIPAERGTRFNDVIADPAGRVFCGTMPGADGTSRLYRLDRDGMITRVFDGLGLANGMGFTPDGTGLYLTDSPWRTIRRYAYDAASGALGPATPFVQLTDADGFPDGLTVDAAGHVWSARWAGGCVVRYTPDGTAAETVRLPVRNVTSLTFGGDRAGDLYITTAGQEAGPNDMAPGAVYHLRPGVTGRPEFQSRVRCDGPRAPI